MTYGKIVKESRFLQEEEDAAEEILDKNFEVTLGEFNENRIEFKFHFADKKSISKKTKDKMDIIVRNPGIFKTAYSLEPVKLANSNGRGSVLEIIPPLVDKDLADQI